MLRTIAIGAGALALLAGCQDLPHFTPATIVDLDSDHVVVRAGRMESVASVVSKAREGCASHGRSIGRRLSASCVDEYCEISDYLHACVEKP